AFFAGVRRGRQGHDPLLQVDQHERGGGRGDLRHEAILGTKVGSMGNTREVVVTGGGTGIGYAVAAAFAGAGERVTITGRREKVLSEAATLLGARAVVFDAADPAAVEAALAELPDRVDVLVHH